MVAILFANDDNDNIIYRNFFGNTYITLYTSSLLDFQKHLLLCKYFVVQYEVGLLELLSSISVYLQTIWGVQRWSGSMNPLSFANKDSNHCRPIQLVERRLLYFVVSRSLELKKNMHKKGV